MTYTIEAYIENHLTMDLCHKADEIVPSGMIEEVLPHVISFHDLEEKDIEKANKFIIENFNNPKCDVAKEHYKNGSCLLEYINKEVCLSK